MIKTFKEHKLLYCFFLFSLGMITISPLISGVISLFAFVLLCVSFIVLSESDSIVLLIGIMPFANIFKMGAGETSLFTVCEIFLVLYLFFKKQSINGMFAFLIAIFTVYMVIFSAGNLNILLIVKIVLGFLIVWFSTIYIKKQNVRSLAYIFSVSTILSILLSTNAAYFSAIESYFVDLNYYVDLETGQAIDVIRNGGLLGDPNYCSVIIIVAVALLSVLYYYRDIGNEFWLLSMFLVPLGFLTYSKSYFLCVAVLAIFLTLFVLIPKHKGWAIVAIIAGIIILGFVFAGKIEAINMILERFADGNLFTNRDSLNHDYIEYIFNNPKTLFFGDGISADRFEGAANNVHNIYIQLLYNLGIVGGVIYIMTCYFSMTVSSRYNLISGVKTKFVNCIPILFLMVMFFFLSGITKYELPFYFVIAYVAFNYNRLKEY